MNVTRVQEAPLRDNPHSIEARQVVNSPGAVLMHLTVQAGQAIPRHAASADVVFFVLEGHGVIECGDEQSKVGPDTAVQSRAGMLHGVRNTGSGPLRLLVVKTPPRA
jgi:mannose-6-phosphate isomerase-like protein (cupin superfamily)